ncbi:MAG: hypothetical protein EA361_08850 [Bacteroidetes bacterium]|nr:MAG: hypothetical protein EA361_08850 [Bacteroidota bacterium]
MIPQSFEEWKSCLIKCNISPNAEWARERLKVFTDSAHPETRKFIQSYGEQHLNNVIQWYKQIQ